MSWLRDTAPAMSRERPPHLAPESRRGPQHELRRVLREGDDVDVLAPQLVHDHADTAATGAHAGAHGIDVVVVGPHRDLGPVPGFPGQVLEFDHVVGDLGHLSTNRLPDQPGVGAADHDLGGLW